MTDTQNTPHQEKEHQLNRKRFLVEILTLFAVLFYGWVAYKQWGELEHSVNEAKRAADAATSAAGVADATLKSAKKSFEIEQRPYMITEIPQFVGTVMAVTGNNVRASITFRNIGRTPALKVVNRIDLVSYRPTKSVSDFVNFLERAFLTVRKSSTNTESKYKNLARRDIAPTAITFSTAEYSKPFSAQDIRDIETSDLTLFYVGVSTYTDTANGVYETEFCYLYFGTDIKTWHICDAHNTIK